MKIVLDSSAFAKRFIAETGSQQVDAILRDASELGLSILCVPELVSALNRRVREGLLPPSAYTRLKLRLTEEVNDATILQLTPTVTGIAVHLLENHILRASDALHIACAIGWEADLFVTADRRQLAAARAAGVRTQPV